MIEDLFNSNKSALDIPEVQDLLNRCKRVESINSKLFQRIHRLENLYEELCVFALAISEIRDVWRKKAGLLPKGEIYESVS